MSRPVPLLFIHYPTSSELFNLYDEESTTIFQPDNHIANEAIINTEIQLKLKRLSTSFGQRVYQNISFITNESTITGNILQIDEELTEVHVQDKQKNIVVLETKDILDIQWRGKSLPNI